MAEFLGEAAAVIVALAIVGVILALFGLASLWALAWMWRHVRQELRKD